MVPVEHDTSKAAVGSGGNGLPSWFQYGTGTIPFGNITPVQTGAVYVEDDTGTIWVAMGPTSSDWLAVGGKINTAVNNYRGVGASTPNGTPGNLMVFCDIHDTLWMGDVGGANGTGNGLYWFANGTDGQQSFKFWLGSTGQYNWIFADDGSSTLPGIVKTKGGLVTDVITSGALPTVAVSSGTAFQVSTLRDAHLCVSTSTAGSVEAQISPDNTTFSTLFTKTTATSDVIQMEVPAGWWVKLTATTTSLGTATYY